MAMSTTTTQNAFFNNTVRLKPDQQTYLEELGIEKIEDLESWEDKELDKIKPSGSIIISPNKIKILRTTAQYLRYLTACGYTFTPGLFSAKRLSVFQLWNKLCIQSCEATGKKMPKYTKNMDIMVWLDLVNTWSLQYYGEQKCSIAWILREPKTPATPAPTFDTDTVWSKEIGILEKK